MRPRSRLPSKRTSLLPTIREGTEETLKEMNDHNTTYSSLRRPASSSEDYFLSICHLAHPTFPTRDVAPHDNSASDGRLSCYGLTDPLEHLYGHSGANQKHGRKYTRPNERKRAHSIPNTSNPDLIPQRKSSCPELHSGTSQNGCLPKTNIAAVMEEEEEEEEEERQGPGSIKPSLISQWISDCRSAWREARSRACLLPAIAEI